MKLIGHMNAMAALRERQEEYLPITGATSSDIFRVVQNAYGFEQAPPMPIPPATTPLAYANGKFSNNDTSFSIFALIMDASGDVVQTMTTDQAEMVMDDLTNRLDAELGFRFASSRKRLSYVSNLVVEFDGAIETHIASLSRMSSMIANELPGHQIGLKRLAFGAPTMRDPSTALETVEYADFVIERRAGEPYEANRYFCSAPMRTADHLRLLAELESVFASRPK